MKIPVFLILALALLAACQEQSPATQPTAVPISQALPTATESNRETGLTYHNDDFNVSLDYPPGWQLQNQSYQWIVLIPEAEIEWQPTQPTDFSRDPAVQIEFGAYIREKLGPASFPESIDAESLQAWLMAMNGETAVSPPQTINGATAFTVTETVEGGCRRAVYWRATNLENLVRLSTGCQSAYPVEFERIVNSLR